MALSRTSFVSPGWLTLPRVFRPTLCVRALMWGALPLCAIPQTAPAPSRAPEPAAREGALELTPFEVNTSKDRDFVATSAGSATRMALDMKDVGAAYSVMTRDFIEALNISNLQEAVGWSTNGAGIVDGNGQDVFNVTTLMNVRGVGFSSGQTRNYYLSAGTQDSYALERYEFGRGPNAALFNIGSNSALGGGISATTKRARYDKPFETIGFTTGSWEYYRGTLDVNRPLTDKLAVRGNAVWFDRKGWRLNEFEKTKGLTGTASYLLTPKTEFRLEGARDITERNVPVVSLFDKVSGWDGVTVFDGPVTDAIRGTQTGAPGAANGLGQTLTYQGESQGVDRRGSQYYVWSPASGQNVIMNYQNEGLTRRADETARTPILSNGQLYTRATMPGGAATLPFGNGASASFTPTATSSNNDEVNLLYQLNLPADRYNRAIAGSNFELPGKRFTNSPDYPILRQITEDVNFALTHQIGDHWFFEIGGDLNDVHDRRMNSILNYRQVRIDINRNLPDGKPNPNFLEPYSDSAITLGNRYTDNDALRGSVAYKNNFGRWGAYTVNLGYADSTRQIRNRNFNLSMASLADPRMWQGGDDLIRIRQYWNQESRPYGDAGVPTSVFRKNFATDNNSWTTATQTVAPRWVIGDWNDEKAKFENVVLGVQAKYFKEKLSILAITRQDSYRVQTRSRAEFGDLPADWDGSTLYFKPAAPADWTSLTYTPVGATSAVPAASRPRVNAPGVVSNNGVQLRDPRYTSVRFRNDYSPPVAEGDKITGSYGAVYHALNWLSLGFNYSTSYALPPTNTFDLNNAIVVPQEGEAIEPSVTVRLGSRFTATARYFYNREDNARSDPPTKTPINNLLGRNAANDPGTDSVNARGIPLIIGTDYFSRENTGYEFEIVGTPLRGWRLSASAANSQVNNVDRWQQSRRTVPENAAFYRQVLEDAGGMLTGGAQPNGAPGRAVVNPAVTAAIPSEQTEAVNNYNQIWDAYQLVLNDAPQPGADRWVINGFTDYTFQTGRLKNVRLGGGVQWRDNNIIGYRSGDTIVSPSDPKVAIDDPSVDLTTPILVKQPFTVTMTAGYSWRLPKGRALEFNLVVKNVLNNQAIIYQDSDVALRAPNGDLTQPNRVAVPVRNGIYMEPTSFQFTTTLRF